MAQLWQKVVTDFEHFRTFCTLCFVLFQPFFPGKHLRLVDSEEVLAEQRHIKRHRVNLVSQVPIPMGTTFENTKAIFLILKTLIAKFIPETISGAGVLHKWFVTLPLHSSGIFPYIKKSDVIQM